MGRNTSLELRSGNAASTVAVRGSPVKIAVSPKTLPGPSAYRGLKSTAEAVYLRDHLMHQLDAADAEPGRDVALGVERADQSLPVD